MKILPVIIKYFIILNIILASNSLLAETIRVAVASNFSTVASHLVKQFEAVSGHNVTLIVGSTGKHYAQIRQGAPFDVFLAADSLRPERLQREGYALPDSRFTYAIGKLVLWSPNKHFVDNKGEVLEQDHFQYLAIANPKLAPYGLAAREVLQKRSLWHKLQKRIVRGENIAQAFQFVKSGNAAMGFVAYSQVKQHTQHKRGSMWFVPDHLYTPVTQQAVLLKEVPSARQFLTFLRSQQALNTIRDFGYNTP